MPNDGAPLEVVRLTEEPGPGWDETVAELGGCAFHSRGFGLACGELSGENSFLVFRRDRREVGYAIASSHRTRWRPLGWARDVLELASPPVLTDEATRPQAVEALVGFARQAHFGCLRIGSVGDPKPEEPLPAPHPRAHQAPRLEYRVPIGPDFPATLARMAPAHRRKVRKVLEGDFGFEEQSSMEGALRLHTIAEQVFERRHARGETEAHGWELEDYRKRMAAYLRHGLIRFFFTLQARETLSGIGIMPFKRTAFYLVGGTTREGYERQAAYAMFAHIIQQLIADGFTEMNLGGTGIGARDQASPEHGLYRHKAGYGGRVFELTDLSLPLTPWRWWPALPR
ncbi:MAG TPA: GNAT family N-acetyltransferase [Gemmatimonadales bacterium]